MELQMRARAPPASASPTVTTLPSELLRLIVGYLAPSCNTWDAPGDLVQLGSKKDLQSASLAHSCFHQWVPEFLFRDMTLNIVTTGMSSQLERFLLEPLGATVSKYIKSVQVQVPPAIRWEINYEDAADTLEENTRIKLCRHFQVEHFEDLTIEQKDFCEQYHFCMIEPFTTSARWFGLVSHAYYSCKSVFPRLPKLEHVGCGISLPEDHPSSTTANAFMKRWADDVAAVELDYVYDFDINLAWISGVLLHSVPEYVKSLTLRAANLDNLSRLVTVNRLLSVMCKHHKLSQNPASRSMAVTTLSLTIGGVTGTHGTDAWNGNTGSIGMVTYWADAINLFPNLTHLALAGDRGDLCDGNGGMTNHLDHDWMTWLFRRLVLHNLENFSLNGFEINQETLPKIFESMPNRLRSVWLRHIILHKQDPKGKRKTTEPWIEQVAWLTKRFPSVKLTLGSPLLEDIEDGFRSLYNYPQSRAAMAKLGVHFEE